MVLGLVKLLLQVGLFRGLVEGCTDQARLGCFLWRGVFVELEDMFVNGLNQFRRLAFFAGIESNAVVFFDWDLRSVGKSRCVKEA